MEAQQQLGKRSKLYKSNKESPSLKTTIPNMYVELCGITDKDELEWSHERIDGDCVLRVKVVKPKLMK
jgi:hypothetical protein